MAAPTKMPELKVYSETIGNGGIVLDMRYFPVLVLAWQDELSIPMLDRMVEIREPYLAYADQIGTKIIIIIDTSKMQVPSATVRKYSADLGTTKDLVHPSLHAYIPVLGSAVMRGVATAINWVTGDKGVQTIIHANLDSAMLAAQKMLAGFDIDFTRPEGYQVPFLKK